MCEIVIHLAPDSPSYHRCHFKISKIQANPFPQQSEPETDVFPMWGQHSAASCLSCVVKCPVVWETETSVYSEGTAVLQLKPWWNIFHVKEQIFSEKEQIKL